MLGGARPPGAPRLQHWNHEKKPSNCIAVQSCTRCPRVETLSPVVAMVGTVQIECERSCGGGANPSIAAGFRISGGVGASRTRAHAVSDTVAAGTDALEPLPVSSGHARHKESGASPIPTGAGCRALAPRPSSAELLASGSRLAVFQVRWAWISAMTQAMTFSPSAVVATRAFGSALRGLGTRRWLRRG